jgi:hypothetical protein
MERQNDPSMRQCDGVVSQRFRDVVGPTTIAKSPPLDHMSCGGMTESRRVPSVKGVGNAAVEKSDPSKPRDPELASPKPSGNQARFIGAAMKTLFESSDVSIKRGDETRVMSRAQDALENIQRRQSNRAPPSPENAHAASYSSSPPRPRVDAVLWVVLALGLFAIAGWMIAYAL